MSGLIKGDQNVGKKANGEVTVKVANPKPQAKPEAKPESQTTGTAQTQQQTQANLAKPNSQANQGNTQNVNQTQAQTQSQPQNQTQTKTQELVNPYPQFSQKTPTGPVSGVGPQLKVGPKYGVGPNIAIPPPNRLGVGPANIPYANGGQMGMNNMNNQMNPNANMSRPLQQLNTISQNSFQRNISTGYQNMQRGPNNLQQAGQNQNQNLNTAEAKNLNNQTLAKEEPKPEVKKPEPEPVREIYKTMYPDSKIVKYEGEMKNGKRHGLGKSFYKSGQLMYEGTFINDMPDDNGNTVKLYYENTNIMYEGKCQLGVKVGFGKIFWDNGQEQYAGNWYNNMPDGEDCKVYGKDGSLIFEGRLVNGINKFAGMVKYQYGAPI